MRSDLDRLLEALYEATAGEPRHRVRWMNTYRSLLQDALSKAPATRREDLLEAIRRRYREYKRQRRVEQIPKLPRKA